MSNKRATYLARVAVIDIIRAKGNPVRELRVAELKIILAPLKQKEDGAMPNHKKDLLAELVERQGRMATIVLEAVVKEEAAESIDKDEAVVKEEVAESIDKEAENNEENDEEEDEIDGFGYNI